MCQTSLLDRTLMKRQLLPGCQTVAIFIAMVLAFVHLTAAPLPLDDQYFQVVTIIQEGDLLKANGQNETALKKYQQAQVALYNLQKFNPNWNAKMVSYRLSYLADKVAGLQKRPEAPEGAATSGAAEKTGGASQVKLLNPGANRDRCCASIRSLAPSKPWPSRWTWGSPPKWAIWKLPP